MGIMAGKHVVGKKYRGKITKQAERWMRETQKWYIHIRMKRQQKKRDLRRRDARDRKAFMFAQILNLLSYQSHYIFTMNCTHSYLLGSEVICVCSVCRHLPPSLVTWVWFSESIEWKAKTNSHAFFCLTSINGPWHGHANTCTHIQAQYTQNIDLHLHSVF